MSNNCLRCGYSWSARSKDPLRCPHCKSTRWNKEVIKDLCMRCGAEWIQRSGEVPKYCPVCHSSMWNAERITYTCPKCGKTRALRSNSRIDLCPVCDVYSDHRKMQEAGYKGTPAGISDIIHLWSNGAGLTLTSINNGSGIASLYEGGSLVGEINIESWCRSHGITYDPAAGNLSEAHREVFAAAVEKIRLSNMILDEKSANIGVLRGVSPIEAQIIQLSESGMAPLPIALKLNVPFTDVMDVLASVPPVKRGHDLMSDGNDGKVPERGHLRTRIDEKV
ncbi:MAG: hypothetical protein MJZ38_02500 [archaeon]|nr:hypothetical protein [archaeon]